MELNERNTLSWSIFVIISIGLYALWLSDWETGAVAVVLLVGVFLAIGSFIRIVPLVGVRHSDESRLALAKQLIVAGAVIAVVAGAIFARFYIQMQVWQVLACGGASALAFTSLMLARWSVHRHGLDVAGYWIVGAIAMSFGICGLVSGGNGLHLYYLIGGTFLVVVVGGMIWSQEPDKVWRVARLYVMMIVFASGVPFPRYDFALSYELHLIVPALLSVLLVVTLVWLYQVYKCAGALIRARLLFAFATAVLLPIALYGIGSILSDYRVAVKLEMLRLETITALKEAEVQDWVNDLKSDLVASLTQDDVASGRLLLQASPDQDARNRLEERLRHILDHTRRFEELYLLNLDGRVVLSTNVERQGVVVDWVDSSRADFERGLEGPFVRPPQFYPLLSATAVMVVQPVAGERGGLLGFLIGRASGTALSEITSERVGLRETGEVYLVGKDHQLLTVSRFRGQESVVYTEGTNAALEEHVNGGGEYDNYRGVTVLGAYRWLPELQVALLAEIEKPDAMYDIRFKTAGTLSVLMGVAMFILSVSFSLSWSVVDPLSNLAETAAEVAAGDLTRVARIERGDEIGTLARVFNDMTARLRDLIAGLEQRVVERTAELAAVNKDLEAFAYSVSHDLRAPLRSIDGFSRALLEDYADGLDAKGQDYLQRVRAASQRMRQRIDDLLILFYTSRREMRYEKVDLSALAQEIVDELQQNEPERQVQFIITPGLIATGDAHLLRVALENLLDNAWKFTVRHTYTRIEFGLLQVEGEPAYFVRDNGAGFDMAYANKLFGAFQRLHSATEFEGTGIGLATVQRIIHRHGGRVWAEGAVEQGATFYFTLG